MLAIAKVNPDKGITLIDVAEPKIKDPTDVIIEVGGCGICGTDLDAFESLEVTMNAITPYGFPRVLGHEVAGTIVEMGKDVTGFKVGDHVACETAPPCGFCFYCTRGLSNICARKRERTLGISKDGGLTRYMTTSCRSLYKISPEIPFDIAATLITLGTSYRAIEVSRFKPGDTAVVIGPGPLGIIGAMLLMGGGVKSLLLAGRTSSRHRLKVAAGIGIPTLEMSGNNLLETVQQMTEGRGADVVFDFAGGIEALKTAVSLVRGGGEVVVTGSGDKGEFDPNCFLLKEMTITGSRARSTSTWHRSINIMTTGAIDLKKVVTHVIPIKEHERAFELLFHRDALKVVMTP